jgi:hypothetical protein
MQVNHPFFHGKQVRNLFIFVFCFSIFLFSCKDEIIVGSELLDDQLILVDVTDAVEINSFTEFGEPFNAYNAAAQGRRLAHIGRINDGLFGDFNAELAITCNIVASTPPNYPIGTKSLQADSLVLSLLFDTLATYGDLSAPFRIEVRQLNQKMPTEAVVKSDYSFLLGDLLVDTLIRIKPKDSVTVYNFTDKKNIKVVPQLRLVLPKSMAEALLNNKEAAVSDTSFVNFLKGLHIRAIPQNDNGIFGFNLSATALVSNTGNKLFMYYTESDTLKKTYSYPISSRFVNTGQRDFTGSVVSQHVENNDLSNQLTFLQGFGGPRVKITLSNLDILKNKIINYAELTVTADKTSGLNDIYPAAGQLFAFQKNSTDSLIYIQDIYNVTNAGLEFGGIKKEVDGKVVYSMNITNQLKKILEDPTFSPDIYLRTPFQEDFVQRSVIYGAKHDLYKMKLKVNFTTN